MDDKIKNQLKIDRIRNMKNPIIVMNDMDFELLKNESLTSISKNPTCNGIPITCRSYVEKGSVIIYDSKTI